MGSRGGLSLSFFVAGGTVPPGSPSYVARAADRELYEALLAGEFCFVLNSRQMGKSSLAVRTIAKLNVAGVGTAFVDLTRLGATGADPERWYAGLLVETGRALGLRAEAMAYLREYAALPPVARLFGFLRDVALARSEGRVVLMLDEIDAVRSLPFPADDLFAGLRELWNARVTDPALARLTVCLLGAALPSDLIVDPRRTPFNVGRRIELRDFTVEEARPFAAVVGQAALARVMFWTGGHPLLTQSLCAGLEGGDVDALVRERYLDARARETDTNLADVGRRLLGTGDPSVTDEDRATTLALYERMLRDKPVQDDESNPVAARIKMSGVARVEDGLLKPRNRIYESAFDRRWVRESTPGHELRRQRRAFWKGALRTSLVAGIVIAAVSTLAALAVGNARRARALGALAARQRDEKEYQAYVATLNLMKSAYDSNDLMLLDRLLEETRDSRYRNVEWRFWEAARHEAPLENLRSPEGLGGVAISADGSEAAIQDEEKHAVEVRSLRDLTLIHRMEGSPMQSEIRWLGRRFVVFKRESSRSVRALDVRTGKTAFTFGAPHGVLFFPKSSQGGGSFVCQWRRVGSPTEQDALVYDGQSGRLVARVRTTRRINQIEVSDDGARVLAEEVELRTKLADYVGSRSILIRDSKTQAILDQLPSGGYVQACGISRDGRRYACGLESGVVRVQDVDNRRTVREWRLESSINGLSFSWDASRLLVTTTTLGAYLFDVASGRLLAQGKGAFAAAVAPDGRRFVVVGRGTRVYGGPASGSRTGSVAHTWISLAAFGPHGRLIAQGGQSVRVLDPDRLSLVRTVAGPSAWHPISGNGAWTLISSKGGVEVTDPQSGAVLTRIAPCSLGTGTADVSPTTGEIAAVSEDSSTVTLWSRSGKRLWSHAVHGRLCDVVAWSHDGRTLAIGYEDGQIVRLDRSGREVLPRLEGYRQSIGALAFSRDDSRLAVVGQGVNVMIFETSTGTSLACRGHNALQRTASFTPDGSRLLTASDDGTARVWDTRTGQQMLKISRVGEPITSAIFSPDGQRIFTSTMGGFLRRYDLSSSHHESPARS